MEAPTIETLAVGPADACKALGVGRTHLYKLLKDGKLPSVTSGRRRLIPVAALRAYLDADANVVDEKATA